MHSQFSSSSQFVSVLFAHSMRLNFQIIAVSIVSCISQLLYDLLFSTPVVLGRQNKSLKQNFMFICIISKPKAASFSGLVKAHVEAALDVFLARFIKF